MMALKGEQPGCPNPGGRQAWLAGPRPCQPTAAKPGQPEANFLKLAQEDGGGTSTLQLRRTTEVAALEQEEEEMCFAARCGLMVGHEEGGGRSPVAGRVCECCHMALGVLAPAQGQCTAFCCLGVPSECDGTSHEGCYSSVISPFCALGAFLGNG